jgi:GDPmannose 4,6-dehydratase
MKTALITVVTGQDSCYVARSLPQKSYKVYADERRATTNKYYRLNEMGITDDINFIELDLIDQANIRRAVEKAKPDIVYNLAAQSFKQPELTSLIGGLGF